MSAGGFPAALAYTLSEEGGFVDNPKDPGGATNKGITIGTYRTYHPGASVDGLRIISDDDVAAIYHAGYWNAVRAEELPAGVDLMVFDFGVTAGPGRSIGLLQSALGVSQDRILGPVTMKAVQAANPAQVVRDLGARQLAYYKSLPTWPTFGEDWEQRTDRRTAIAEAVAGPPPAPAASIAPAVAMPAPAVDHATAVLAGLCIEAEVFTAEDWTAALAKPTA